MEMTILLLIRQIKSLFEELTLGFFFTESFDD